jgi:XTP/dITP diphosphohydrolase
VPLENAPRARYISLSNPWKPPADVEEYCCGRIRFTLAGSRFCFDPLFEVIEYHRTFGELGLEVKSVLSHRSRAVRQFVPKLLALKAAGAFE